MIPSAYRSRLAVVNKIQYCVALRRDGLCDTQRRRLVIIYTCDVTGSTRFPGSFPPKLGQD